jgi:hypothetical protein
LAGPPADFLNAAPIGLPENRTSLKGSFSTKSGMKRHREYGTDTPEALGRSSSIDFAR